MSGGIELRRLLEADVLKGFASGTAPLDEYICRYAKQDQRRNLSTTWLATSGGEIAGFVTLVSGTVAPALLEGILSNLPKYYPVPVLLLARMATDIRFRGKGVGRVLMNATYRAAVEQRERSGCAGIFTDAKPASESTRSAVSFYQPLGFEIVRGPTETDFTTGMFLTLAKVEALIR